MSIGNIVKTGLKMAAPALAGGVIGGVIGSIIL